MSGQDQAQYILSLTLTEWKAIRKACQVLRRAGMTGEQALAITVQAHQDARSLRSNGEY